MQRFHFPIPTSQPMREGSDGPWVKYVEAQEEKLTYGRASFENGRKQGAEEERAAIVQAIIGLTQITPVGVQTLIERIKARGAEPMCTCLGSDGSRHYPDCPCYKPTEPKCECGGTCGGHYTGCKHNGCNCEDCENVRNGVPISQPGETLTEVRQTLKRVVDAVNRIDARGR